MQADRETVPAGPELVHLPLTVHPEPTGPQRCGHPASVRNRRLEHVPGDDHHQVAVAVNSVIPWGQNGNPETRTVLARGDNPPEPPAKIKFKINSCRTTLVKPDSAPPSLRMAGERTKFTGKLPDRGPACRSA